MPRLSLNRAQVGVWIVGIVEDSPDLDTAGAGAGEHDVGEHDVGDDQIEDRVAGGPSDACVDERG